MHKYAVHLAPLTVTVTEDAKFLVEPCQYVKGPRICFRDAVSSQLILMFESDDQLAEFRDAIDQYLDFYPEESVAGEAA